MYNNLRENQKKILDLLLKLLDEVLELQGKILKMIKEHKIKKSYRLVIIALNNLDQNPTQKNSEQFRKMMSRLKSTRAYADMNSTREYDAGEYSKYLMEAILRNKYLISKESYRILAPRRKHVDFNTFLEYTRKLKQHNIKKPCLTEEEKDNTHMDIPILPFNRYTMINNDIYILQEEVKGSDLIGSPSYGICRDEIVNNVLNKPTPNITDTDEENWRKLLLVKYQINNTNVFAVHMQRGRDIVTKTKFHHERFVSHRLIGCVVYNGHYDSRGESMGHYFLYFKAKDNGKEKWYKYDDIKPSIQEKEDMTEMEGMGVIYYFLRNDIQVKPLEKVTNKPRGFNGVEWYRNSCWFHATTFGLLWCMNRYLPKPLKVENIL